MAVTRDQARRLLSESEMTLFSESRNTALRSFSARELTRRIERARRLRDKSRDLLQRQRLGSRQRTGTKGGTTGAANERTARKGEVLDDILQRFESRLLDVQSVDEAASTATAGARTRKQAAARPAARKTVARGKAAPAQAAPRRVARKATVAASGAAKAPRPTSGRAPTGRATAAPAGSARKSTAASRRAKTAITPEQAMAQTRELLQAKQQRDRAPRAYQVLDESGQPGLPEPGYQSGSAHSKAQELHAGEVRLEPIHGSISTRDRQSQGKRDHR